MTEFGRLLSALKRLSSASVEANLPPNPPDLDHLLSEAEFALVNGDIAVAVARLEAVLSMAHKLILQAAPSGPVQSSHPTKPYGNVVPLPSMKNPSILCVDDDSLLLECLRTLLSSDGFDVVTVNTSSDALRAIVERDFSLVITDLLMPGADGREVAIAAKKSNPNTKVVVLTAYSQMSMLADLLRLGVDNVLYKQADVLKDLPELLSKLKQDQEGKATSGGREKSEVRKHVFISYCRENAGLVRRLREDLVVAGENVWWDQDILPGQDWKLEIRRAMRNSYAVILCLSKESSERVASGIYSEAADAIAAYREYGPGSIFLIPVRLSNCQIPPIEIDSTRTLDRIQYIDLFPRSARATSVSRLVQAIKAVPLHP